MLDKTGTFEIAEPCEIPHIQSDKMKGCYIANVKNIKAKHDPPSPADLAERRAGVKFMGGDIDAYLKDTINSLTNAAKALREMEEKTGCDCKNCKKEGEE